MNKVQKGSFAVLLLTGIAALVLGARIGSAPDVFAWQLGLAHQPAGAIEALALRHGGSLLALGGLAIAAAFLAPARRWLGLAAVLGLGLAAWFGFWQFGAAREGFYAPVLVLLGTLDLLALAALAAQRDADRPLPKPTDAGFHIRWG